MSSRNPSRSGKSAREKQALFKRLKGVSSEDTGTIDLPFEPSNLASEDKTPKANPIKRPVNHGRIFQKHFSKHWGTYLQIAVSIVLALIVVPIFNMNRELGEVQTKYGELKNRIDSVESREKDLTRRDIVDGINDKIETLKEQSEAIVQKFENMMKQIASIRAYLTNKFNAKLE